MTTPVRPVSKAERESLKNCSKLAVSFTIVNQYESLVVQLEEKLAKCKEALDFYAKAPCAPEILERAPRFRDVAQQTLSEVFGE